MLAECFKLPGKIKKRLDEHIKLFYFYCHFKLQFGILFYFSLNFLINTINFIICNFIIIIYTVIEWTKHSITSFYKDIHLKSEQSLFAKG